MRLRPWTASESRSSKPPIKPSKIRMKNSLRRPTKRQRLVRGKRVWRPWRTHDGVGHRLTSLIIGLESLEMMIADDPATASNRVSELVETARWALQDVRQAVRDRGDSPRAEDLDALIAGVRERAPLSIEVNWAVAPEGLPAPLRGTIFNVLQEALTNILRHAQAHHVRIHLAEESNQLRFEVADDGILQAVGVPGFGLTQMRQRCQAIGGALQLTANVPHGLSLSVTLPYVNKEDNSHADTHFSGR